MNVDSEAVIAEVTGYFHAYEHALMRNDVATLTDFFWHDERLTRYGIADRQLGFSEQQAYRASSPAPAFTRTLENLRIHSFGADCAVAQVEFVRSDTALRGFQSQTWVRLPEGWKIVAAHVSMVEWPGS
jgi:hypothetical protein